VKETADAVPEQPKKAGVEENSIVTTPKAKSSKKKRKSKDRETIENEPAGPTAETKILTTPKSKKKKKKEKSPPSVDPRSMHSPDQVISPDASDYDTDASASKRVSFGAMNHCKSHKASMKAMKGLDKGRWDTTTRTPDKGILRAKDLKSSGKGAKPPLGPSSRKRRGR